MGAMGDSSHLRRLAMIRLVIPTDEMEILKRSKVTVTFDIFFGLSQFEPAGPALVYLLTRVQTSRPSGCQRSSRTGQKHVFLWAYTLFLCYPLRINLLREKQD